MILIHNTKSNIVINDFENRKIQYAFHDIDGTHFIKDGKKYILQTKDLCKQARLAGIDYSKK